MKISLSKYLPTGIETEGGVYAFPTDPSVSTFLHMVLGSGVMSMLKSLYSKNNSEMFHSLYLNRSCTVQKLTTGNYKTGVGVRWLYGYSFKEARELGETLYSISDFVAIPLVSKNRYFKLN